MRFPLLVRYDKSRNIFGDTQTLAKMVSTTSAERIAEVPRQNHAAKKRDLGAYKNIAGRVHGATSSGLQRDRLSF